MPAEKVPGTADKAIKVWRFDDAPQELQDLSTHGGDEDWLALIPPHLAEYSFGWMDDGTPFGVCRVSEHPMPDGSLVKIGAHA